MVYGKQMVHLTDVFKDEQHRKDWQFWSRDETDDEAIIRRWSGTRGNTSLNIGLVVRRLYIP